MSSGKSEAVPLSRKQLTSGLIKAMQISLEMTDEETIDKFYMDSEAVHFHDGSQVPIAWNNVQAVLYFNEFAKRNLPPLLQVPEVTTEGYNQHYHTSEFDGGAIPGINGVHDHRDNQHGGFAFAVYHPSTAIPQMGWEESP